MEADQYKTISKPSEGLYKDKGSKFIAYAFPISSKYEVKNKLEEVKKSHYSARHHCYAYILGIDQADQRSNDDGEPSNSAGKPILGQILSKELTNVLIVVVRYFGGTKLGVGGLVTAYKQSAKAALEAAEIITKEETNDFVLNFTYEIMNDVMAKLKQLPLEIVEQEFLDACTVRISTRKMNSHMVQEQLSKISTLDLKLM